MIVNDKVLCVELVVPVILNMCIEFWFHFVSSFVVVPGMKLKLRPFSAFKHWNEAVSDGKLPAGKGVDSLLSWHGSHFCVCITCCNVRQCDPMTLTHCNQIGLLL